MMLSQEQSMNQSNETKLIHIDLTLAFEKNMTPNILTPKLCEALKEIGASYVCGNVKNVTFCANEENVVTIVNS